MQMKKALWLTTVAMYLSVFVFAMDSNSQGVLLTSYIDAFQLRSAWQGVPNAAANVGNLLAMLLCVPIASRMGKTRLHALGLGVMAVMLLLVGCANSAAMLCLCYLAMGFGFGSMDSCASSVIADLHPGKRADLMMGILHASYGAGGILIPMLVTGSLSRGVSWRAVLYALSALTAVTCALCALIRRFSRGKLQSGHQTRERLTAESLRAFFAQAGNLPLMLATMCYCGHQIIIMLWVSRVLTVGFGSPALGSAAFALFWGGTVASRLLVPLTRVATIQYLRYGVLAAGALLLAGTASGSGVALCAAAGVCGLFGGAMIPMTLSEISRRNPKRSMLSTTAVLLTYAVASMICSPLAAYLVSKTSLIAAMAFSGALCVGSAACAFLARKALPEQIENQ